MKKLSSKKHILKSKKATKKNLKKIAKIVKQQIKLAGKIAKFLATSKKAPKFDIAASTKRLTEELAKYEAKLKAMK